MTNPNRDVAMFHIACASLLLLLLAPPGVAATDRRETIGPMTITVPSAWIRSVDARGTIQFAPDATGQSQYSFSKVDDGTPGQLDGHRLMWGEIKKNAGITTVEQRGKAGRFDWSQAIAQDRTAPRTLVVRFYSTKEGSTHVCAVIVATTPALLLARTAELEKILAAAEFGGTQLPAATPRAAAPRPVSPAGDVPIVGAHVKVDVRFGGIGGSGTTTDHILLFANGVAVRTGVIVGAIECYALLPVANLLDLPFNYGRWRQNDAAGSIDVQWKEGGTWQMKREGALLSVDGRKLLTLRPLETARFDGVYVHRPVGGAPTGLALLPDGRFEAQDLTDNMVCAGGQPAPRTGRGTYEVRKWTLILRFEGGGVAYLPLHVAAGQDLAAVRKFWVKSYEFELAR